MSVNFYCLQVGANICSIDDLLMCNLDCPPYQRPYKWGIKNISDLLGDMESAIHDSMYREKFKYRIGTVILHKEEVAGETVYHIVDGQQRLLSLVLIKSHLTTDFSCTLTEQVYEDPITQRNLHDNYQCVRDWFLQKQEHKEDFNNAFTNILEAVVIVVENRSEAFQLFDSQNTRGKELDPHDLLKAYHLREMKEDYYEMQRAVTRWEDASTEDIRDLFYLYLFPALNWMRCERSIPFSDKQIDVYKGISERSSYTYARRASQSMPYFQINHPFIAGNDFFAMVDHYLQLLRDIKAEVGRNFKKINALITTGKHSTGFKYAVNLFYCVLLCYYDKFHNFDPQAVSKLFTWSLMLRVDMRNLGFDSVNKYAIGDSSDDKYTNTIPMFAQIAKARMHTEISNIPVRILKGKNTVVSGNKGWFPLYESLKELNGLQEAEA